MKISYPCIAKMYTYHRKICTQGWYYDPHERAGSYRTTAQIKDCPALKLVVHAIYL